MPTLLEFLKTFDRASLQSSVEAANAKRDELRKRFPPESLATLPLDHYGIGQDDPNTLCRLLEFGSDELGSIRGGSSFKFGVYCRKEDGVWISKLPGEPDPQKAWEKLRTDLVQAVEFCRAGEFEQLDALPAARFMPAARTKLMHIYFPDEVLGVYSLAHLKHYLNELGNPFAGGKDAYTATANRQLLTLLRGIPQLADWSPIELAMLLWGWNPPAKPKEHILPAPEDRPRMMKIAPGEKGRLWDECLKRGCIAVGWNAMGNLWDYPDLETFIAGFQEKYPPKTGKGRASNEETAQRLWQLRELEPGDLIVANKGTSTVLAVGKVTGPVRYEPGGFEYEIVVPVEWDTSYQRNIPAQRKWAFYTIGWVDPGLQKLIMGPQPPTRPTPPHPLPEFTLNRILYGPPGTGKTYSVIREAVEICDGSWDNDTVRQRYVELSAQGRIRFVTFHQSYAYEDFMEGIRPVLDDSGRAGFEMKDGVFKEIVMQALAACLDRKPELPAGPGFLDRWAVFLNGIGETGSLEIPGLKDVTWRITATEKGNLRAVNKETNAEMACGRNALAVAWEKLHPTPKVSSMEVAQALGKGAHYGVLAAVYNYLQQMAPAVTLPLAGSAAADAPDATGLASSFLERGEASGWKLRVEADRPRHVLIMDEINRGNISRVFGELITLIEDDKRLGAENALTLTLPVSRDLFSVPPNLHLLGTMNTADKSLALLDVALRRRFEFEELAPDFELCADLPPEMAAVLERLNARLERRRDRDHRIGHAFFMAVEDARSFNEVFRRKVVPLLQEYFFSDVEGARYVLGEEDRKDAGGFLRELKPDGDTKWARQRWRWFTDEEPDFDCWARLAETLGT